MPSTLDFPALMPQVRAWGYQLLPEAHRESPGHPGLLVSLAEQPAGTGFCPDEIRLRLRDSQGLPYTRALTGRSLLPGVEHVCPGRIVVRDRPGQRVEFLTFGGTAETLATHEGAVLVVRSPVPILELATAGAPVAELLAAETAALLGEADAASGANDEGFQQRLAEVDPTDLYVTVVNTLLTRCRASEEMAEMYQELCEALADDKRWLAAQGRWPLHPPALQELLAPRSSGRDMAAGMDLTSEPDWL